MAGLEAGSRVGPYEIVVELGAGGMGVVYRARDTRLGRDVAVKVMASALSRSLEAVHRFELEARAAGALDHPNVLTVHDVGTFDGAPYLVSELLAGETLRDRLHEQLPLDTTLAYAAQIASGLAAAHEKGIVHRDLKPENLFVTSDGRIKIIDFGVAKLLPAAGVLPPRHGGNPGAAVLKTLSGAVLGTVGYMSPEQVGGKAADRRSDIFAFGTILHEMLSGRRAFSGGSPFQTGYAILSSEPSPLPADTPAELSRIIRRCLAKNPDDRYQSARELEQHLGRAQLAQAQARASEVHTRSIVGAALSTLRNVRSGAAIVGGGARARLGLKRVSARLRQAWKTPALRIGLAVVIAGAAVWTGLALRSGVTAQVSFQQLTFRKGTTWTARFAPDGETVVYSAAWDGKPTRSYTTIPGHPESRLLDLSPARVFAVSRTGELALALDEQTDLPDYMRGGTLARASLVGGAPRELLTHVSGADWKPDGTDLAIIREVEGRSRLELPPGNVLYESSGWLSHPRVSPAGHIAFIEHPFFGDTRGVLMLAAKGESPRPLTADFGSAMGLAWSPNGEEIWFSAGETSQSSAVRAVGLHGGDRLLLRSAGSLTLHDVARDGRVLVAQDRWRNFIRGAGPREKQERDLTYLDYSIARELSGDGQKLLFFEAGQGGGELFSAYLRPMDGSAPVHLGPGYALSITSDGTQALLASTKDPSQLAIVPTGPGQSRTLTLPIAAIAEARWFPDGKTVLLTAHERANGALRVFVLDVTTAKLRPLTEAGVAGQESISKPVSPNGKRVIVRKREGFFLHAVEGSDPTILPALEAGEVPIGWFPDGGSLLVRRPGIPVRLARLDLERHVKSAWREFAPPDVAGVSDVPWIHFAFTPTGEAYAYSYHQITSELYLVRGLGR